MHQTLWKIRKDLVLIFLGACIAILIAFGVSGCFSSRTVYIKNGDPVRLRQTIEKVKVWVIDEDGEAIPGEMDLPEGWFALPLDAEGNGGKLEAQKEVTEIKNPNTP